MTVSPTARGTRMNLRDRATDPPPGHPTVISMSMWTCHTDGYCSAGRTTIDAAETGWRPPSLG